MIKNFFLIIFMLFLLTNCASVNELKERAKGDGVPYIPGI